MRRVRGFTLIELLFVIVIFGILIGVIFSIYAQMISIKTTLEARQTLIDRSYFLMEKLHVTMSDYTIDYEEYYNRSIVGCDSSGDPADTDGNGHCDLQTYYGNGPNNVYTLDYCSSTATDSDTISMVDCLDSDRGNNSPLPYRSYARTHLDVMNDVDLTVGLPGDEDDIDMGTGALAIDDPTELYLINYAGDRRLFIRRALVGSGDRNNDGSISTGSETLYTLQQLQLVGLDAGYDHNFQVGADSGVFDGHIDTRRCDADSGYLCNESILGSSPTPLLSVYDDGGYAFAQDQDDGWVDIFDKTITVSAMDISITPNQDPAFARANDAAQVSPYITLNITTHLNAEERVATLGDATIESFNLPLQTTFATKPFYR